jgi:energy-coupling factor transporter ATP-binding protein EcfA2
MSGAILGIPKKEIDTKFNDIVDFAELWDFIDVPVKKYSSGMYARLGFSVAVSVNPDILIIDETLSVGDIFFQQKCFKRIRRLLDDGITLFFVSHDLTVVQTVCPRAILVDRGVIKYDGPSVECVSLYYALNAQGPKSKAPAAETSSSPSDDESNETVRQLRAEIMEHDICGSARSSQGDLGMEITGASFQNEHGDYNMSVEMMKTATIRIILKANQFIPLATAGFSLFDRMNNLIFSAGLTQVARGIRSFNSGEQRVITYRVQFSVKPGEYVMALGCAEADTADLNQGRTHHRLYGLGPVQVYVQQGAAVPFHGMASMPMEVSVLG